MNEDLISETMGHGYSYRTTFKGDHWISKFKTKNGHEYQMYFFPSRLDGKEHVEVFYRLIDPDAPNGFTNEIIGGINDIKVISTVFKILKNFIRSKKPDVVDFRADQPRISDDSEKRITSRSKLYNRILKNLEPFWDEIGYEVNAEDRTIHTIYTISKRSVKEAMITSSIIEAAYSLAESVSYTYKMPNDREMQLYDFYLLSLYDGLMKGEHYSKRLNTMPGIDGDTLKDLEAIVKDGVEELVTEIRQDLLDAIVTAVSSEFRHIWDKNNTKIINEFMEKEGVFKQFKKWARHYYKYKGSSDVPETWKRRGSKKNEGDGSSEGYTAASNATRSSGWDIDSFMDVASKAFTTLSWTSSYGGKNWSNIANSWKKLKNAPKTEWSTWIDHVFDLEHNTGTMLNKVRRFGKDGDYSWIKRALDAKFEMTPIELARASSIPMSIASRLNRITGASESVQKHDEDKENREKEKPDVIFISEFDFSKKKFEDHIALSFKKKKLPGIIGIEISHNEITIKDENGNIDKYNATDTYNLKELQDKFMRIMKHESYASYLVSYLKMIHDKEYGSNANGKKSRSKNTVKSDPHQSIQMGGESFNSTFSGGKFVFVPHSGKSRLEEIVINDATIFIRGKSWHKSFDMDKEEDVLSIPYFLSKSLNISSNMAKSMTEDLLSFHRKVDTKGKKHVMIKDPEAYNFIGENWEISYPSKNHPNHVFIEPKQNPSKTGIKFIKMFRSNLFVYWEYDTVVSSYNDNAIREFTDELENILKTAGINSYTEKAARFVEMIIRIHKTAFSS